MTSCEATPQPTKSEGEQSIVSRAPAALAAGAPPAIVTAGRAARIVLASEPLAGLQSRHNRCGRWGRGFNGSPPTGEIVELVPQVSVPLRGRLTVFWWSVSTIGEDATR